MTEICVDVTVVSDEGTGSYDLKSGSRIRELLEKLNMNPETVVARRNGKIVPEDEGLEDKDEIEIIPVVSGG